MNGNPETLPPQFESGQDQSWRDGTKKWFKNNSSIILAIVIIIVLTGGIYAYTQRGSSQPILFEELEQEESNNNPGQEQDTTQLEILDEGIGGPDIMFEQEMFTEKAERGDGVTHLARRALAKYLEKTGGDPELTKEHKIYIEDYMQNRTSDDMLEIGETLNFSKNLIDEAIQASKNLTEAQLQNIAPFANMVF